MNDTLKAQILSIMDAHRIMTVATLRSDGWPQATTVGYANEGLTLYFLCGSRARRRQTSAATIGSRSPSITMNRR